MRDKQEAKISSLPRGTLETFPFNSWLFQRLSMVRGAIYNAISLRRDSGSKKMDREQRTQVIQIFCLFIPLRLNVLHIKNRKPAMKAARNRDDLSTLIMNFLRVCLGLRTTWLLEIEFINLLLCKGFPLEKKNWNQVKRNVKTKGLSEHAQKP